MVPDTTFKRLDTFFERTELDAKSDDIFEASGKTLFRLKHKSGRSGSDNTMVAVFENELVKQVTNLETKFLAGSYKKKDAQSAIQFFEFLTLYEYSKKAQLYESSGPGYRTEHLPALETLINLFDSLESTYEFTDKNLKLKKATDTGAISDAIHKIQEIGKLMSPIDQLAMSKYIKKGIKILRQYEQKLK